ncbi:MAG: glycosyltransferase family 39 protein [Anaerolineae bacterium]|nr:glycosyltransferase family 39 protein [Anaerolineae bacterium]
MPCIKGRPLVFASLILLAYIGLGLACGLVVPPFENLDEIEHFGAIRYVADTGQLPVHGTPVAEEYHYRQEASQPPLYYVLSAALVRILGLRADDMTAFLRFNPWVACGPNPFNLYDNRAILYHNPHREAFPWRDTLLMLHVLRAWSTLLQTLTVLGIYALGRLVFPDRPTVALLGMAVAAFNPQFLLVASGVNNDNLVTPLATLALYTLLRTWRDGFSVRRSLGLGLLIGLAGLSKLSGWVLLLLTGVIFLLIAGRRIGESANGRTGQPACAIAHRPLSIAHCSWFIAHGSLVVLPALALSGWWFWRNWQLYGDPTALKPMLALVGERGSPIYPLLETGLVFRSFWGQISCAFYPAGFYAFYTAFTLLALGGLLWGWRRLDQSEKAAATILLGWFLLIVISWARWDMLTPAPGGRLLFPALPAIALVLALGLDSLRWTREQLSNWSIARCALLIVALLAMALWAVAGILPGFFAPPPRYTDPAAVRPQHALDATVGNGIRLMGYNVALEDDGPTLDVTLYWQASMPLDDDYTLALQLVSPVPGDTTLRLNYNSWPGRGNYPTSAWRPDEVIADRYRLRLPEAGFPTQAWDLHVMLFRRETGERLPVRVNGLDSGNHLILARLRVPGRSPLCPEEGRLTAEVRYGTYTALTHAQVIADLEATRVVLCWKALASLPGDYTVFVHALDESGALISTGDGPPMQGAFPTSLWQRGDIVMDEHRLPVPAANIRIAVGLYNLTDGSRLPALIGHTPVPDASVIVWPERPQAN